MRKAMLMVALVLAMASAAQASQPPSSNPFATRDEAAAERAVAPAPRPEQVTVAARPAAPAEEAEEFAGTTMLRFFTRSIEAARTTYPTLPVTTGASIQMAAY